MPSDIRSFFGGKASAPPPPEPEKPKKAAPKKGRGARKVIEESDEEEEAAPKPKVEKKVAPAKPKREATPEGETTTTADYFANSKPKRSEPVKAAAPKKSNGTTEVKTPVKTKGASNGTAVKSEVKTPSKATPGSARSTRGKAQKTYTEDLNEDDFPDDLSEEEPAAMVRATPANKKAASNGTAKSTPASSRSKRIKKEDVDYGEDEDVDMHDADDDFVVPDEDEEIVKSKPAKGKKAAAGTKRKAVDMDDDEEEAPKKGRKTAPKTKKAKDEPVEDSAAIQDIMASIPTIRAPTPPPEEKDADGNKKKPWLAGNKNQAAPAGAGTKEIPTGAPNCLAGRTFVFTGILDTLQRDDGIALVKRYGGKVTSGPSSKTSFIVLGNDAGPSKLKKIQEFGLKTINEDGLFELIRKLPANGGDSKAAAEYQKKEEKEQEKIQKAAQVQAEEERKAEASQKKLDAARAAARGGSAATDKGKGKVPDTRLWTVKYAPTQLSQICGNQKTVEKLQKWLRGFPKALKTGFKLPGADGFGAFRAVLIHGPPGIGKTTAAHLVAKMEGYDIVESNASDSRSKKLVETGLKGVLDTRSLLGYFAGDGKDVEASKRKLCLIMDEVDGMSAGDRGGVGAMAAVCKKSNIPIIMICNDRKLPKMKPFDFVTYDMPFRRPTTDQIRSRIMTILFREGMKMPKPVVDALIEGTGADIRQVVNMVSTAKLNDENMDFEDSKAMSKAWEKHIILKPWDIIGKILGGGMFSQSSKATLNDKIELYFNDHEFSPIMLQENYLGTNPIRAQGQRTEKLSKLKALQLASDAADSISDGDLVDRMIHGSQQQWSLMPTHAVFSFVRPASYVAGSLGYSGTKFTSWLGQNSAQGKLSRYVKEIQGHMRLRTTGDRHEVRQQYMPLLWTEMVKRLQNEGKEAIDEIISLMDSYYLTKDDFDAIMELGVGPHAQANVKIETQDKSAFTREYNKRDHPLPFIKASSVQAPKKLGKDKPDLEEAIEESDEEEVVEVKEEEDEELDLSKDKYVKQPKKKKAPAKGKGTKKAAADDDEEEDEKPKKGKGKAAAKGKGKGKK
ncbi:replication factor C subunit 1 [Elsinoe australis]|uniref:Replication factor C subunit 1 n=1 Tax=Elsinoe australis TaxID=40998 RepID=A0A4U7AQN7_9PEZI|nr:replication factor C subunit 1 [Elsinoe australis]